MKNYLLLFSVCIITLNLSAQSYNTTAGIRLGTDWGITAKQRVYDNITGEFILQSSLLKKETMVTVLGAYHQKVVGKRFNLFYGGGIHKGWIPNNGETAGLQNPFGIDLIGGIELTAFRINFSYDLKPGVNLVGGQNTLFLQSGLSARFVFIKNERLSWEPDNRTLRQRKRERNRRQKDRRRN
ncbi:MAG: hypothetical protein AAF705_15380 [Bacteroidota bacterium]